MGGLIYLYLVLMRNSYLQVEAYYDCDMMLLNASDESPYFWSIIFSFYFLSDLSIPV
jgi:hypothetical protein